MRTLFSYLIHVMYSETDVGGLLLNEETELHMAMPCSFLP